MKNHFPVIILLILTLLIFILNYKPGTILTGWDNLHPEFYFEMNIKRSIFAVWQEYQGLGLLGGMGHAADLPRQLFLYLVSIILPMDFIRYFWTFLTLFLGPLGTYYLLKDIVLKTPVTNINNTQNKPTNNFKFLIFNFKSNPSDLIFKFLSIKDSFQISNLKFKIPELSALLGALFYLLNLSTIQTFHAPFEAFLAHFAFLPWIFYAILSYFQNPNKKTLLFLSIILLISAPQAYIPTLFLVTMLAIFIILITLSITQKPEILASLDAGDTSGKAPDSAQPTKFERALAGGKLVAGPANIRQCSGILKMAKIYLVIFIINAFWLLPFLYFTFTNVDVNLNAKINQMATPTILYQNKEFGNIENVALLKGFWFNNVEPNSNGQFAYMLPAWKNHLANPYISAIGYFLFFLVLLGFILTIRPTTSDQRPKTKPFATLFIFVLFMMVATTPPFSWINSLLRENIPLFNQMFRFPFTKFSILTSLTYAILFAVSVKHLMETAKNIKYQISIRQLADKYQINIGNLKFEIGNYLIFILFSLLLIIYTLPIFQGHLFYEKEKLTLPKEYLSLFDYFKHQNPNTRIANFPQNSFWGWEYYNFGYGGSGFPWYGIKQPILDRAFDVWSKYDENYYFELSNAIYSKNTTNFKNVLNKYQINFLILDKNVISPSSPKSLFYDELEDMFSKIPQIKKDAQFGNITVYKVTLSNNPQNFIFTSNNLPQANPYNWTSFDQAYQDLGTYISSNSIPKTNDQRPTTIYPFRSLFSLKTPKEQNINFKETQDSFEITEKIKNSPGKQIIQIPSLKDKESIVALKISTEIDRNSNLIIKGTLESPQVYIEDTTQQKQNQKVWGTSKELTLFSLRSNTKHPLNLNINGIVNFEIENPKNTSLGTTFLSLTQNNVIVLSNEDGLEETKTIENSTLQSLFKDEDKILINLQDKEYLLKVNFPKIEDNYLNFKANLENLNTQKCDLFRQGEYKISKELGEKPTITLSSQNSTPCFNFYIPSLFHEISYLLLIDAKNIEGRPLHFWMENSDEKFAALDTYLPSIAQESSWDGGPALAGTPPRWTKEGLPQAQDFQTHQYVVPPMEPNGLAYSLHFDNISIGSFKTTNSIQRIDLYQIPYNFLTSLKISSSLPPTPFTPRSLGEVGPTSPTSLTVLHPNESLYIVEGAIKDNTLILSQAFDPGWKAYVISNLKIGNYTLSEAKYRLLPGEVEGLPSAAFPFLFGKEIKDHVMVNNWENAWILPTTKDQRPTTIVIVYLPQYLEYLGFTLLILYFTFLISSTRR